MTPTRILASIWLVFVALVSVYFSSTLSSIESHELTRVLAPGYDTFGRNCVHLTAFAIIQSIRIVFPLSLLCLTLALIIATATILLPRAWGNSVRAFTDACLALPGFLIALSLGVLFTNTQWVFVGGAVIIAVPSLVRFFEGQLLLLSQKEFIEASRALGASQGQLFRTHFFREITSITFSFLPFLFLRLILLETSLSFLGLSAIPEHETWGRLLHQGKDYFLEAPWILWIAGIPLILTLFSFHLLSREDEG